MARTAASPGAEEIFRKRLFDFESPIEVVSNGKLCLQAMVEPSARTLLHWASRDRDRTMLYGVELEIEVGGAAKIRQR